MQFHLNGFRAGDPLQHAPATALHEAARDCVDVLIVGCGPAGLTLAAQLSAFPHINTRIVEQKEGPIALGQADGIACRTMEMFEAFGFAERIAKEACWINETTFWKPDEHNPAHITRGGRVQDVEDGLSEFPHVVINQARVHDYYLEKMHRSPRRLAPDYGLRFLDLNIDESRPYPVEVRLAHGDADSRVETINARYVVGCDGARSAVRWSVNLKLEGESANQAWGVMDVLAVTSFPDVRYKVVVRSASEGNALIIPREGGYLFRLYLELDQLAPDERIANKQVEASDLIAAAQRIFSPYTFDVKEVAWWSVYEIGQRLCRKFDDVPEDEVATRAPRVFICGDACHTHSPKAGQGMNVSMGDAFNLGWKLAAVLSGRAEPQLLHTYSAERQAIAADLIEFDRHWAKRFSERPKTDSASDGDAMAAAEFQRYFTQHGRFTAGTAFRYAHSSVVGDDKYQHLATGFEIGTRFHSAPVVRLCDAKPVHLGHKVKADGRWRMFVFADQQDPSDANARVNALCEFLRHEKASPISAHTPPDADIDSVIEVCAVFQQSHQDIALERTHALLKPAKGRYGLHDMEKMFCVDHRGGNDIFLMRGIDKAAGCIVVVRPDQYIAHVLPLDSYGELSAFFQRIFTMAQG